MEVRVCECGKPLPFSGWKFCAMCGRKVSETPIYSPYKACIKCNFIYISTNKYCINCGEINEYLKELLKK